jgi:hypothetical protein
MNEVGPVHGRTKMVGDILKIRKTKAHGIDAEADYRLTKLTDYPAIPGPAYQMQRLTEDGSPIDGFLYTVSFDDGLVTCSCGDWTFRRANSQYPCKHGVAAILHGLFPGVKLPKEPTL